MRLQERIRVHSLTIEQLRGELRELERALLDLHFDAGLNKLSNTSGLRNTRKKIAAMKTIIREKELLDEHGFTTMEEYKAFQGANRKAYSS